MTLSIIITIVAWVIGMAISYKLMASWPQPKWQKAAWTLIWPLILILYGIHWLHMKL